MRTIQLNTNTKMNTKSDGILKVVFGITIAVSISAAFAGCSQSKQDAMGQKLDSTANAVAERAKVVAAEEKSALETATNKVNAATQAVADSVAKVAADDVKQAAENKANEVSASIKKQYPYAYDLTPVDTEPETDMKSLKKAIVYPKIALDKGLEGRVSVRALIGANGRILKSFTENSSNSIFDEPAQTAVRRAAFTPAIHKGKKIQRWISVPVLYRLL
jgi:TonB family protein